MKNQFSCMPPRRKTAVVLLGIAVITTTAGNSHYAILPSQENGRGLSATMQCTHNTCNTVKKMFLGQHALSLFLSLSFLFFYFLLKAHHPLGPMEVFIPLEFILWFLAPAVHVETCPCCFMFNKIHTILLHSEVPMCTKGWVSEESEKQRAWSIACCS